MIKVSGISSCEPYTGFLQKLEKSQTAWMLVCSLRLAGLVLLHAGSIQFS
jgi:hypothetical protein